MNIIYTLYIGALAGIGIAMYNSKYIILPTTRVYAYEPTDKNTNPV